MKLCITSVRSLGNNWRHSGPGDHVIWTSGYDGSCCKLERTSDISEKVPIRRPLMAAPAVTLRSVSQAFTYIPTHSVLNRKPSVRLSIKSQKSHISNLQTESSQRLEKYNASSTSYEDDDDGIPIEHVKMLFKFKSRYNYIRVLEVSRKADHPLAGSRLLLLDTPGNIHSVSYFLKTLTNAYFDVFATIPPIIPPGPLGILGFGAGTAANILLKLYPGLVIHGWELDPSVISVGWQFFGLEKLENDHKDRLFINVGDALDATTRAGFSGILVDLYSKGCLIPELQAPQAWEKLKRRLRKGGRIMVNVGGSCVQPEDLRKDGNSIMEETLEVMNMVFPGEVFVLNVGNRKDGSTVALTGALPDLDEWKKAVPEPLKHFVDQWKPYKVHQMMV